MNTIILRQLLEAREALQKSEAAVRRLQQDRAELSTQLVLKAKHAPAPVQPGYVLLLESGSYGSDRGITVGAFLDLGAMSSWMKANHPKAIRNTEDYKGGDRFWEHDAKRTWYRHRAGLDKVVVIP